jgi:hypothetical protein
MAWCLVQHRANFAFTLHFRKVCCGKFFLPTTKLSYAFPVREGTESSFALNFSCSVDSLHLEERVAYLNVAEVCMLYRLHAVDRVLNSPAALSSGCGE